MGFATPLTLLCLVLAGTATNARGYSDDVNPQTGRPYNHIVIGGLGIRGEADLYNRWNATFSE